MTVCKMLILAGALVAIGASADVVSQGSMTRSLPPPHAGCPRGDPGPLPVLTSKQSPQLETQAAPLDAQAIQSLLREVEEKQKEANGKLRYYSYLLKRTEHELNEQGESVKYRVHEYRVFPLWNALPVTAMLSENGKELSPEKLAKEKARANKEWKSRREKSEKKRQESQTKDPNSKAFPWFDGVDFVSLPPERIEGRDVVVLGFKPRADYSPQKSADKFMSGLQGQVWIDPNEKIILKWHGELMEGFSSGGLSGWLSSLKPGTEITIENTRLADGRLVVSRVDSRSIGQSRGPLLISHGFRFRVVDELSDYREFDPATTDLFKE